MDSTRGSVRSDKARAMNQTALPSVLIVYPAASDTVVSRSLGRHANRNWRSSGRIALEPITGTRCKDSQYVVSRVNAAAARLGSNTNVLLVNGVTLEDQSLRQSIKWVSRPISLRALDTNVLPDMLRSCRLDWRSQAEAALNSWMHADVTSTHVDTWLEQFDQLSSSRWIGERLLRLLDFWPMPRVAAALGFPPNMRRSAGGDAAGAYDGYCVNRTVPGKSADVLATLVHKQVKPRKVQDLHSALEGGTAKKVVFFEDCLLTATEMTRVLGELLGAEPQRSAKAKPLSTPKLLFEIDLELRFAVVANWGKAVLQKFLRDKGLTRVVLNDSGSLHLQTLHSAGLEALESESLFDGEKAVADQRWIVRNAFDDKECWGGELRVARAVEFCSSVGRQLVEHYLCQNGWSWSNSRVGEAALGVRGNALVLAFAHSVPKETLPLLWMGGRVKLNGTAMQWAPLLPNAI